MKELQYKRLKFNIYKIEVGVLLDEDNSEYNCYNNVYDKQHAFYDENVSFEIDYNLALKYANDYVEHGVNGTYAIINKIEYESDDTDNTMYMVNTIIGGGYIEDYYEIFDSEELYGTQNIVYDIWKVKDENHPYRLGVGDGVIEKDFIVKEEK